MSGVPTAMARLNSHGGSLLWAGVFGGSESDNVTGGAIDAYGNAYVCGFTRSFDFPTTPGAYQTQMGTPYPNRATFLACVSSTGSELRYSTYYGGAGNDQCFGMAVDPSGVATIAGLTGNFLQATPGAYDTFSYNGDMFIARFFPDGKRRLYMTFVGNNGTEEAHGMAMNANGRVAVAGVNHGGGYPTTPGSADPTFNGGQTDAVVSVLDLHPTGIDAYGSSTPGCHGPLQLQASEMPSVGTPNFSLICSAAPPNASGWLLISSASSANGVTRVGATLWVDPSQLIARLPVTSDASGFIERPLPGLLATTGQRFFVQVLLTNNCAGSSGWTASNALEITVQ